VRDAAQLAGQADLPETRDRPLSAAGHDAAGVTIFRNVRQTRDKTPEHIAARFGAAIEPHPFHPVLRGMLLTGEESLSLDVELEELAGPDQDTHRDQDQAADGDDRLVVALDHGEGGGHAGEGDGGEQEGDRQAGRVDAEEEGAVAGRLGQGHLVAADGRRTRELPVASGQRFHGLPAAIVLEPDSLGNVILRCPRTARAQRARSSTS